MTAVHSIKFRSALILSLVVTVMWVATAVVTERLLSDELDEVFDSALQETGQRVLELAIIDVLGREEAGLTKHITSLDTHDEYFTYIVRDDIGNVLLRSHQSDPGQFPQFEVDGFHQTATFRFYQETAVSGTITLMISEPMAHRRTVSRELALGLGFPLLFVIPLSILAIIFSLGFGLRPLGKLRAQLASRDENDLAPLATNTLPAELKPVSGTMNQLLDRLRAAFDAERSFTSNAAHELRTPLAGAIAQIQRLEQQSKEPDTVKRAAEIEGTLRRLTQMSERLMQLARAEGARMAAPVAHDLRIILRLVLEDLIQPERGRVTLTISPDPVLSDIDPDATAIVARNLIENALRHGSDAPISVTLNRDGWLRVENDCDPVSEQTLRAMSGRFVRGDYTREGSGLGLAIVQKIADRTGASLRFSSPLPGQARGFCAAIRLGRSDKTGCAAATGGQV